TAQFLDRGKLGRGSRSRSGSGLRRMVRIVRAVLSGRVGETERQFRRQCRDLEETTGGGRLGRRRCRSRTCGVRAARLSPLPPGERPPGTGTKGGYLAI